MIGNEQSTLLAEDHFHSYYTEKIWEMIPAYYRSEDGIGENPGVLRAMVVEIARQAAILRRSQDRLWEDRFIEWCSDWVVPYLADMVGTRLVSARNLRGRRGDVANTIYFRRRKGTPRLLEQLIGVITDWEGKVVENFLRLARSRHGLDGLPEPLMGRFSRSMPGGTANLRSPNAAEVSGGPFDEFFHTPDMRQHQGTEGRYNIPKLAFHLYRLNAYEVRGVSALTLEDGIRFSFDPSGRRIPLFMPENRPEDWDEWRQTFEWELPHAIRCRLLSHAEYEISESVVQFLESDPSVVPNLTVGAAAELRNLRTHRIRTERRLRETLASMPAPFDTELTSATIYPPLLAQALIGECGKHALLPNAVSVDIGFPLNVVPPESTTSGDLTNWNIPIPFQKNLVIDPEHGLFRTFNAPQIFQGAEVNYHYGFPGPIGAGTHDRPQVEEFIPDNNISGGGAIAAATLPNNGIAQIDDSRNYTSLGNKMAVEDLRFQVANRERPYIRMANNWILNTGVNTNSFLTLDGLWIGGQPQVAIILRGDYECVTISHCSIEPGGGFELNGDPVLDIFGNPILPVELIIEARVEQLIIQNSILGPIRTRNNGVVNSTVICDSIVQSNLPQRAIFLDEGVVRMDRVTVFGAVDVHRLFASEVIITDHVQVTDTQNGCFRFSAAPIGSRVPKRYPDYFLEFINSNHWFTSRNFGHPAYAQLSDSAPIEIRRGAEFGSEIAAWSFLQNPIKLDGLRQKATEYMPFGLIPLFIFEN